MPPLNTVLTEAQGRAAVSAVALDRYKLAGFHR